MYVSASSVCLCLVCPWISVSYRTIVYSMLGTSSVSDVQMLALSTLVLCARPAMNFAEPILEPTTKGSAPRLVEAPTDLRHEREVAAADAAMEALLQTMAVKFEEAEAPSVPRQSPASTRATTPLGPRPPAFLQELQGLRPQEGTSETPKRAGLSFLAELQSGGRSKLTAGRPVAPSDTPAGADEPASLSFVAALDATHHERQQKKLVDGIDRVRELVTSVNRVCSEPGLWAPAKRLAEWQSCTVGCFGAACVPPPQPIVHVCL